jgi:hypothetical protein
VIDYDACFVILGLCLKQNWKEVVFSATLMNGVTCRKYLRQSRCKFYGNVCKAAKVLVCSDSLLFPDQSST